MASSPIIIAGGGIAGLAAALGFAQQGRESIVFEQAAAFEEVGAGLQLGPNAVRALQWLGAWEAIAPSCVAPAEILVGDGHSGKVLQRIALGQAFESRFAAPYRVIHRGDLLHGLLEVAQKSAAITLHRKSPVRRFVDGPLGIAVILASGERINGSHLIAADGIHSPIREQMLNDGPPLYRDHTIYRALPDITALPDAVRLNAVCLWLCRGGHLVHYPVSGGGKLNLVAAIDQHWVSDRWNEKADSKGLHAVFGETAPPLAVLLGSNLTWRKWAAAERVIPPNWTKGRVTLTGDAAHASLPYLAQGAAMALEDAVLLARHLNAPEIFSTLRRARVERVQRTSRQLGRIYHLRGVARLTRNLAMTVASPILDQLAWLYSYDPAGDA
jgi:2-polyprenyl-6-methoxyphenol hydroxylase-like FAD-dependent oxidoreductase